MKTMAGRVAAMQPTIFAVMTALANEQGAINLGQGFPDCAPPPFLVTAAKAALDGPYNQYAPGNGQLPLRQAIATRYHQHYGLAFDPQKEILVTVGATEALFAAMMGLLDPGDEVIVFEPAFDSYRPAIEFGGGTVRPLTLRPPHWHLEPERLQDLIGPRTRMILLNSPQNPCGKVFGPNDLWLIADLCIRHDLIAVTDEVYEAVLFDGREHIPLAGLPGMAERTLTISSLAKTFSVTGWKIGWAAGPEQLIEACLRAKQFVTFCGAAPLQIAGAKALGCEADYYLELAEDYRCKRDFLSSALTEAGFDVFATQGSYYLMADISGFGRGEDMEFCRWLTTEIGVAAIPAGPFYSDPREGKDLVRFAFCKSMETLEEAARRLKKGMR